MTLIQKIFLAIVLVLVFGMVTGCSTVRVDESRAGCTQIDGKARYGTLTQYVKGDGDGVYVYIGTKLKGKVKVTCSKTKQEIIYGGD